MTPKAGLAPTRIPLATEPSSIWPRLSFTQGVLLGQLSMVVLAVLFLRYVVFEDPDHAAKERRRTAERDHANGLKDDPRRKRPRMRTKDSKKATNPSVNLAAVDDGDAARLLSSLSYDLSTHAPESLDWLNVLIAQLLSSYRLLASHHATGGARGLIEEALNRKVRPVPTATTPGGETAESSAGLIGLDEIEVDEVELGEGYPELSNARVRPSGDAGEGLRVELDLDYSDTVSLALSTRVVMNFPRPRFAVLPVSLSLTLQRFSGTVTVELPSPTVSTPSSASSARPPSSSADIPSSTHSPPPPPRQHPSIHLSLHPDFTLDLSTSSLLGSRAKLEDVPKVEQLLVARIRAAIQDRVVWPGRVEISLPGVSPHSHTKRHSADLASSTTTTTATAAGEGGATARDGLGGGGAGGGFVDGEDWTVVDRPHSLAVPDERIPPSFSVSDFRHRNADSDSDTDDADGGFGRGVPEDAIVDSDGEGGIGRRRVSRGGGGGGGGGGDTTPSVETPSIDFSDPSGPTISLHPKIHRQSEQSQPNRPRVATNAAQQQQATTSRRSRSGSGRVRGVLTSENLRSLDQLDGTGVVGGAGGNEGKGTARRRPASPTESFPGYFPAISRTGLTPEPSRRGGEIRYRGIGGVGVGLSTR